MRDPRPSAVRGRVRRVAAAVTAVTAATAATAALVVAPSTAFAAPAAVEGFAPFVGQASCDPTTKPGTVAFASYVLDQYDVGRSGGTVRECSRGGASEHKEGRAWDWMLNAAKPAEKAAGDEFVAWLTAKGPDGKVGYNARRLGVMYVIWDKQWWPSYRADDGWLPYRGASPHSDHVHVSLSWNGAMKRTSFWTGRVSPTDYGPCRAVAGQFAPVHRQPRLTPCPKPAPAPASSPTARPAVATPVSGPVGPLSSYVTTTLRLGSHGPAVKALQTRLGLRADGAFGPGTRSAVVAFQASRGLTADGVVGRSTWAALLQTAGPAAKPVLVVTPANAPAKAPAKAPPKAPAATPSSGLMAYAGTTLRQGSRGEAVKALQYRLRLPIVGTFGPATTAAVTAFQRSRGLIADGVVGRVTWAALAGQATAKAAPAKAPVAATPAKRPAAAAGKGLMAYAGTTLRVGSKGEAVRALQYRLRLPLVGTFGPATKAAVIAFQTSRRLPADGVVGPATWAALAT